MLFYSYVPFWSLKNIFLDLMCLHLSMCIQHVLAADISSFCPLLLYRNKIWVYSFSVYLNVWWLIRHPRFFFWSWHYHSATYCSVWFCLHASSLHSARYHWHLFPSPCLDLDCFLHQYCECCQKNQILFFFPLRLLQLWCYFHVCVRAFVNIFSFTPMKVTQHNECSSIWPRQKC